MLELVSLFKYVYKTTSGLDFFGGLMAESKTNTLNQMYKDTNRLPIKLICWIQNHK
jgi:hypothetical protein